MKTFQALDKTLISTEKVEDDIDLEVYEKAIAEHKANPVTFSLDEVERELGLR